MEIFQDFGNDLILTGAGDLLTTNGVTLSNQRIVRRLLTNPLDYLWEPTYGAGVPQYIGKLNTPDNFNTISATIKAQMYLEQTVSQSPEPVITLTSLPNELQGSIVYTNVLTESQVVVTFSTSQ